MMNLYYQNLFIKFQNEHLNFAWLISKKIWALRACLLRLTFCELRIELFITYRFIFTNNCSLHIFLLLLLIIFSYIFLVLDSGPHVTSLEFLIVMSKKYIF